MTTRSSIALAALLALGCKRHPREEPDPFALTTAPVRPAEFVAGASLDGRWQTRSGACNGAGAGDLEMTGLRRGASFELTYTGGVMLCAIEGRRCLGTWRGHSGSGWFQIAFTPDGNGFSGTWGYGSNHDTSGTFSGRRG